MKILLVEDNPLTAKGLQYLLEREHYQVVVAASLSAARASLAAEQFQLLLLDVNLPDGDGFALMREPHQEAAIPTIFLTASDDESSVIRGLELGAEDYVTKPFHSRELLLRIKRVLTPRTTTPPIIEAAGLELNRETGDITVDGKPLVLSALERRLLTYLVERAGQIVTREQLLDEIYQASGKIVNDNTLSVYLKRLREKLPPTTAIITVRNLGYRLEAK